MPLKRKRQEKNTSLAPGEKLKRNSVPQVSSTPWGWVATEVSRIEEITLEHCLSTCNFCSRNRQPRCRNIYAPTTTKLTPLVCDSSHTIQGELADDIIVLSDTEDDSCLKRTCKSNPFCLNYLGQDNWEAEAKAETSFIEMAKLGQDPCGDSCKTGLPVGLKNLGATCYANASLQVWFRDLTFRAAVYSCEPPQGTSEEKFKESPVSHLQATFASLQLGNRSVFNPIKLVESLQLRTSEQQDAQEFSKLFMSHLDAEFKKQMSPELQSLIADQFQGHQVYGTICHHCKTTSESSADFLEVEISLSRNCVLEDCIESSLAQEILSGDNRYFCSRCSSLQDATRYTQLQKLPPVLHISLLRFVYDVSTMERKKSKHSVSFPTVLDMDRFVGPRNAGSESTSFSTSRHVYELRGILLHKGTSAYHGHYEAQVKDPSYDTWFQFNDNVVTQAMGFNHPSKVQQETDENGDDKIAAESQVRKHRNDVRKRRRADNSDEEGRVKMSADTSASPLLDQNFAIKSQDAYMLIYSRREPLTTDGALSSSLPGDIQPPERAMRVVEDQNATHDDACADYAIRKQRYLSHFQNIRNELRGIYMHWEATSLEDSLVISRQALEACLGKDAILSVLQYLVPEHSQKGQESQKVLSLDDIVCEHGLLDPLKARDMKVIKNHAILRLEEVTNCVVTPHLKPSDVCAQCVALCFREKYYEIRHPLHVKMFDDASLVPEGEIGVWISRKWCREWRLPRPRIHDPAAGDLPPDAPEFRSHIQCEHGGLTLNIANRRRISQEAVSFLSSLFPTWVPMPGDSEVCASCEAEVHIIKEGKKCLRKQIEEEKARLRFLHEPTLDSWTEQSRACAVLSLHFIRQWKRWINGHAENGRPDAPDHSSLLCEHKKLTFDPNCPSDTDSLITVISRSDWDILQTMYPSESLIALTKARDEDGQTVHIPDVPTCTDCRLTWKTDWIETEIMVRLQGSYQKEAGDLVLQTKPLAANSRNGGVRQSRRLRKIRENGEYRKILVRKSTTVKELKIVLSIEFSIPTICQRLYYQGKEMEDNEATVASANILANDTLDLREAEVVVEIDTDSDEIPVTKRRREEGQGFGGTLLGGGPVLTCSGAMDNKHAISDESEIGKACTICTFVNVATAVVCGMCDSAME